MIVFKGAMGPFHLPFKTYVIFLFYLYYHITAQEKIHLENEASQ